MRAIHLLTKMTLYYLGVAIAVFIVLRLFPSLQSYLPVGGAQSLLSGVSNDPFDAIKVGTQQVDTLGGSMAWIAMAIVASLLTALPVSWTYIACRKNSEYDNSIVRTIIILPVLLTSIVLMVHNSLALAFSLAGIVGAVRFRNSLKSPGDALYILMAIAIGLSAGIGAIEIAAVMSVMVNYCYGVLWLTEFGVREGSARYMRSPFSSSGEDDEVEDIAKPKKAKKQA